MGPTATAATATTAPATTARPTADGFVARLVALPPRPSGPALGGDDGRPVLGLRMGDVFALAGEHADLPIDEVERLLDEDLHEARVGALNIMGRQARAASTPMAHRRDLHELYLRRTDRIDTWDLVDLSAHHVVGGWLHASGEPRDVLDVLAASPHPWERRIGMWATFHLVRRGELDDCFRLAETLAADDHEMVRTVVGGMLREAGKQDGARLRSFLDAHAARMPRPALRAAVEKLPAAERAHYRALR
jgi:3-methyladenine DNA glycosylase AlkD